MRLALISEQTEFSSAVNSDFNFHKRTALLHISQLQKLKYINTLIICKLCNFVSDKYCLFRLEQLIQWETSVLSSPDGMKTGLMKVETAFFQYL